MLPDLEFELKLPDDFDEYHCDSKGWFAGAKLRVGEKSYDLTFYDPVRLRQDVEAEMQSKPIFFEKNLIVVKAVDRETLRSAVDELLKSGRVEELAPSN